MALTVTQSPPPLAQLCERFQVALFLDFDGTLVDIAPSPDAICVPEALATRLEALGSRLEGRLALVSGRSLENLGDHVGTLHLARAGSHGMERRRADHSLLGKAPGGIPPEALEALEGFVAAHPAALVERKAHGAALHVRAQPELEAPAVALAEEVAARLGLAVKRGKCVVELVEQGADKAGAVRAFMEEAPFAGATPVFVGDDVTDEDGFRAARELGGFGIIVGERQETRARYRISTVEEVHAWLSL